MKPLLLALGAAVVAATAAPVAAQEEAPGDTTATPADTLEQEPPPPDARLTWLGDTLPGDPAPPRFAHLPEVFADSLVDPYTLDLPGERPAWILTGEQLVARGAFSLLDVLESEFLVVPVDLGGTGLPVYMSSAHGTPTSVQVFVDGVPVGTPFAAAWDLRQLTVEGIARVAYYPGPRSAVWGGGGTGGVLSITTRRALAPTARSSLSFILGSFDADGFSGNFGRRITRRGEVFIAANFDASEGFVSSAGDFTRNQIVFKTGWRLGDRHRVEFSHVADGLSGRANRQGILDEEDQDRSLSHVFYEGGIGAVKLRGHYWSEALELLANQTLNEEIGLTGASDETGAKGTASIEIGPLVAWGEAVWEESETTSSHRAFDSPAGGNLLEPPEDDPDAPRVENPRTRIEWGGGVGWTGLEDRIAVHAAVRRLDWGDAAAAGTAWRVAGEARPLANVSVRASAGRAVRAADLVGQATLAALATGEIRPGRPAEPMALEEWNEIRGEIQWERPGWRARLAAWRSTGDGAFLWLPPSAWNRFDRGSPNVRLGTIGLNTFDVVDLELTGVELEGVVPLPYGARGILRWRSVDATETITGEELPYLPPHQVLGQVRWARRLFPSRDLLVEARLTGRFSGERTTLSDETLPGYLLTDFLLQTTVINFTVFVSFKNLLGQAYRIEEDFFLPQTEGYFGVFWRFRE